MIRKLISDLAYDKIKLDQALTRAKILAFKIGDKNLKNWLAKELNGYGRAGDDFPDYRVIPCSLEGHVGDGFGREYNVPIAADAINIELGGSLYLLNVNNAISSIEEMINGSESERMLEYLPADLTYQFYKMLGLEQEGLQLKYVMRVFAKVHLREIVIVVKQKLLEMLLELEEELGEIQDDFQPSEEDREKAKQIITNNIYGSNNTTALGMGTEVSQNIDVQMFQSSFEQIKGKLSELGVKDVDIIELESKINEKDNKDSVSKKVMNWVGGLAQKSVEKGVEYKLPDIIEAIQGIL